MDITKRRQEAPGQREPDQGQGTTRHPYITTEPPHIQDRAAQRARLLDMLRRGPVSTLEARAACIMSPAARVFELREAGYRIDNHPMENRVARYILTEEARP